MIDLVKALLTLTLTLTVYCRVVVFCRLFPLALGRALELSPTSTTICCCMV
jgi:hypothetical protein